MSLIGFFLHFLERLLYDAVLKRMERLRSEIRALAHRDPHPADRAYLVALAAVPLTREESSK